MSLLILGLGLFFAPHVMQIIAAGMRERLIGGWGARPYKGLHALVSIIGFLLIIWGFGVARTDTLVIWTPPPWGRPLAVVLNLAAFVLFAAYVVPGGRLKAGIGHPMVIATLIWSAAHLLATGTSADLVLFGAFLVWSVAALVSLYARDRARAIIRTAGPAINDAYAVGLGLALWAGTLFFLHRWLFGVGPLG